MDEKSARPGSAMSSFMGLKSNPQALTTFSFNPRKDEHFKVINVDMFDIDTKTMCSKNSKRFKSVTKNNHHENNI